MKDLDLTDIKIYMKQTETRFKCNPTQCPKQEKTYLHFVDHPPMSFRFSFLPYMVRERRQRKKDLQKRRGCRAERWMEAWSIIVISSCDVKSLFKPHHYLEPWSSCCFKSVTHQRWADGNVRTACHSMNETEQVN